jgi:hypothetical protein
MLRATCPRVVRSRRALTTRADASLLSDSSITCSASADKTPRLRLAPDELGYKRWQLNYAW